MDLITGATVGVEALLRWQHLTLGDVAPDVFIPIAEETGLIVPIGDFVLDRACRQAAAWRCDGIDLTVAVNVWSRQLADAALPGKVADVLTATGLDPHRLCLELTESVLMDDTTHTTRTLSHSASSVSP